MLSLKNVSVDIAGIPVLRGVRLELRSGQTCAVVGRNGAGKTTLLRTIMGFTSLRSGNITLAGEDLLSEPLIGGPPWGSATPRKSASCFRP